MGLQPYYGPSSPLPGIAHARWPGQASGGEAAVLPWWWTRAESNRRSLQMRRVLPLTLLAQRVSWCGGGRDSAGLGCNRLVVAAAAAFGDTPSLGFRTILVAKFLSYGDGGGGRDRLAMGCILALVSAAVASGEGFKVPAGCTDSMVSSPRNSYQVFSIAS